MFDEDEYLIPPLSRYSYTFPDPRMASDEGLLAYGGDLSSSRLLTAYRNGIFPWYSDGDPLLWWSPNPRLLLYPQDFKTNKSFARVLRSGKFEVSFDRAFAKVIGYCSAIPRDGQDGTWISAQMRDAYTKLHEEGFAHSVEVYVDGELVGGLYGIAMGKAFFGESMFALMPDASKVALKFLIDTLIDNGYDFIDCQVETPHLVSLGARLIDRDSFLDQLEESIQRPGKMGSWSNWNR